MTYFWIPGHWQVVHLCIRNAPTVSGSTKAALDEFVLFLVNPNVVDATFERRNTDESGGQKLYGAS